MKYKITLSYDGTQYCGWQSQPNGSSIQDAVERAINALTGESVRVTGSGRTDAGVHAICQVAHFDIVRELTPRAVVGGLNAHLPKDIRVLSAEQADGDFDARKSAKKKTYMYLFYTGTPLPLLDGRVAFSPPLDTDRMNAALKAIAGTHDFKSFMASGSGAKTSVRTVYDVRAQKDGDFVKLFITADGFLYNMVRIIAALAERIGRGEDIDLGALIAARDRTLCARTAPACGLYLYSVEYDK